MQGELEWRESHSSLISIAWFVSSLALTRWARSMAVTILAPFHLIDLSQSRTLILRWWIEPWPMPILFTLTSHPIKPIWLLPPSEFMFSCSDECLGFGWGSLDSYLKDVLCVLNLELILAQVLVWVGTNSILIIHSNLTLRLRCSNLMVVVQSKVDNHNVSSDSSPLCLQNMIWNSPWVTL